MTTPTKASGIAIAVLAAGLALAGCGSDKTEPSSSSSSSSSSASSSASSTSSAASPTPAAGANETIADYIKKNNINEAIAARGDEGAPVVDLPFPEGWEDAGAKAPEGAYGQIVFNGDPALASKPTITAVMSKLSDNADPAQILVFAPGELKNLPDFEGGEGEKDQLSGFEAFKIGGITAKNGVKVFVAQKTTVIPSPNGLFVLQLNAQGPEEATDAVLTALDVIDQQTKITA